MAITAKTRMRAVVSTTGAVVAGPTGAIIGTVVGGFLATVLPGISSFTGDVLRALATRSNISAGDNIANRLTPPEKKRINHDLQTAFRDAFRGALYDIGGTACFPKLNENPERDVPQEVVFPLIAHGKPLWHNKNPQAIQVEDLLQGLDTALNSQKILPLDPPSENPAGRATEYLQADIPESLERAIFE